MIKYVSLACVICSACLPAVTQVLQQDSLALVSLYNATSGDDWTDNTGWLNGPVSGWYGIQLNDDRISQINLYSNNLVGTIPAGIGDLALVTRVSFHDNSLSGEIPPEIGNCAALEHLDIAANELTGTFPMELANCTKLLRIIAYQNQFSGPFPEVFLHMSNLIRWQLGDNNFSGQLPAALDTLTNLRFFTIDRNNFSGPMPSIRNLDQLSEVHIRGNALEGLIDTILGYHPNMYYFTFGDNLFTGCVSDTFFNPERLTYLHLNNSNFDCMGDFSAFADTGVLQRIWCGNNKIPFEYLEPNRGVGIFEYTPQDSMLSPETRILKSGDTTQIYSGTGGLYTFYTWYKNGEVLPGEEGSSLEIAGFQEADVGAYYCAATNDSLPELTLYRHQVHLMPEEISSTGDVAIQAINIYPNPVSESVMFEGLEGQGEIRIFDINGRLVVRGTHDLSSPFYVTALSNGMYVVRVEHASKSYGGIFVKP